MQHKLNLSWVEYDITPAPLSGTLKKWIVTILEINYLRQLSQTILDNNPIFLGNLS